VTKRVWPGLGRAAVTIKGANPTEAWLQDVEDWLVSSRFSLGDLAVCDRVLSGLDNERMAEHCRRGARPIPGAPPSMRDILEALRAEPSL